LISAGHECGRSQNGFVFKYLDAGATDNRLPQPALYQGLNQAVLRGGLA